MIPVQQKKVPDKRCTIEHLARQIKNKQESALAALYDAYAPAVFVHILKVVPDKQLAEDVLQNVFLKVWQHIESFQPAKGSLFTWMLTIARNEGVDMVRSKCYRKASLVDSLEAADNTTHYYSSCTDHLDLARHVVSLRPVEKKVVVLAYYHGYSCLQIAKQLQLPLGTVKTKMQSAYKRLRTLYSSPYDSSLS